MSWLGRLRRREPVPDGPVPFGYKTGWLAVRGGETGAVARAVGSGPRPAGWAEGLRATEAGGAAFVASPRRGWTLVVLGLDLAADGPERAARLVEIVRRLSDRFGECHYYGSYRVVDYVAWIVAREGEVRRAHAEVGGSGEIVLNVGARTDAEAALGLLDLSGLSLEAATDRWFDAMEEEAEADGLAGEETPLALAARWSVSPLEAAGPPSMGQLVDWQR